jgi:3-oxoacyl-[acyl-carrier-protein] synthase-3
VGMPRAYIAGTGHFVPPRVVTNQDLVEKFGIDTTNEWIVQRSGIEQRRFCDEGTAAADLGAEAAKLAVADAGLQMNEIDFIIFATLSPEQMFPGSGVFLQQKLGLAGVAAMDIRNQCSGFLYALAAARGMVETGMAKNVLVVGGEKHSAGMDFSTRGRQVACLFGDGARRVFVRGINHPPLKEQGLSLINK